MTDWIDINERLPDKNTIYAGKYGVSVITVNMNEEGIIRPHVSSFHFDKDWFRTIAYGPGVVGWIDDEVTHWKPMPELPKIKDKSVKVTNEFW
jgi:hypothetical protein